MKTHFPLRPILTAIALLTVALQAFAERSAPEPKSAPPWRYIFTYFDGDSKSGLWLMGSDDGFVWHRVENRDAADKSQRFNPKVGQWEFFRDPSFAVGPDGRYHLVWTTGSNGFGYASSDDITRWSNDDARFIKIDLGDLADVPLRHTWAPEVRYDPDTQLFNILISVRAKNFAKDHPKYSEMSNYRIQEFLVQTADWETFTDPVVAFPKLDKLSTIDADAISTDDGVMLFSKIEHRDRFGEKVKDARGGIRILRGESIKGPWDGELTEESPMLPSAPGASEGPSALQIGPLLVVYHDWGFSASGSFDDEEWFSVAKEFQRPNNWRHGSVRQVRFDDYSESGISQEYWTGIDSTTTEIDPTAFAADGETTGFDLPALEVRDWNLPHSAKSSANDGFQQRIRAVLTAPETGTYTFWVSGDDRAELWMDTKGTDPARSEMIAFADGTNWRQWDAKPEQSASVELEANQKYFIELRHRDVEGDDHASVGWKRPGQGGDKPASLVPEWVLSKFE
ncbi:MAG: PA14 domain-containing protein [Chthoniobacterales bacterium]